MSDDFGGGGRGRGGSSSSSSSSSSSRGSRGGGRGGSRNVNMNFKQAVPKFIANLLASNPSVKLQGQPQYNARDRGLMEVDEEGNTIPIDASASPSSSISASTAARIAEGKERPDQPDEAPQIANLDDFEGVDLSGVVPGWKKEEKEEEKDAAAASSSALAASSTAATAASSSSASSSSSSAATPLSLAEARLLGVKRIREKDVAAEEIEKQTGKHIFRKSIKPAGEVDKSNEGLTPEEIVRKKKRKLEEEKKKKSMLTFDPDE